MWRLSRYVLIQLNEITVDEGDSESKPSQIKRHVLGGGEKDSVETSSSGDV